MFLVENIVSSIRLKMLGRGGNKKNTASVVTDDSRTREGRLITNQHKRKRYEEIVEEDKRQHYSGEDYTPYNAVASSPYKEYTE